MKRRGTQPTLKYPSSKGDVYSFFKLDEKNHPKMSKRQKVRKYPLEKHFLQD